MKMASRLIDLISKKPNCACSTLFPLTSKKQICTCSTLFCLSLAVVLHEYNAALFCTTKTSNFLVTHYLVGGIVVCAYPIFCFLCSCSFLFSLPLAFLIFSSTLCFFMFFFLRIFNNSLQLFLCYPRQCKHKKKGGKRHDFVVVFTF